MDEARTLTRRDLLRLASTAGAVALGPVRPGEPASAVQAREPLQALTATEGDLLDAIVARLVPTDASGPGATEAMAARYIDRALAGALAGSREAYRAGLAALDGHARSSKGRPFIELSAIDQDAVLLDSENASAPFFTMLRTHTIQGTFGDPFYGGNANFVGWDLIGYPGVRTYVAPEEQRIGITLAPNHKSAYDGEMFNRATARAKVPTRDLARQSDDDQAV